MDKKQIIAKLADEIKKQGFRPFIAEKGDYGFFTDAEGSRIVSFGFDLGGIKYSGNYKTSAPNQCGTGWRMEESFNDSPNCDALFKAGAPQWATSGATWRYTTLAEHLATYQQSSKYTEAV